LDKDFIQYVYARIEKALIGNAEYKELQSKCVEASKGNDINLYENLSVEIEAKAEELCYMQGYKDGLRLVSTILLEGGGLIHGSCF
jgi:predicted component of viral defense system (DUF524 family)